MFILKLQAWGVSYAELILLLKEITQKIEQRSCAGKRDGEYVFKITDDVEEGLQDNDQTTLN